jgi:hypothetical protein
MNWFDKGLRKIGLWALSALGLASFDIWLIPRIC